MKVFVSTGCLMLLFYSMVLSQNKFDAYNQQKKSVDLLSGICMSYIDTGNPSGTPLLLLHGYTDTSRSFQLLIEDLMCINTNVRIIAPDLRGHGNSSVPDAATCKDSPENCFAPSQFSCDVIQLMDVLKIEKAHVIGHSMGSIIAQTMALENAGRVSSMVLMETFVNGKKCTAIQELLIKNMIEKDWRNIVEGQNLRWPSDAYSIVPLNMGDRVLNYLRENWVIEPGATTEFLEAIFPETVTIPLGTWIGTIKALGKVDYSEAFRTLEIPTLILWAAQDVVTNEQDQHHVKEAFKKTQGRVLYKTYERPHDPALQIFSGGLGHNLHWSAHHEVAEDIDAFIRNGKPLNAIPYTNPYNSREIFKEEGNAYEELK